ncbi:MAG: hypothetical protein MJ231_01860 [bacterium]|nr:hypothetical protein [bacterium]
MSKIQNSIIYDNDGNAYRRRSNKSALAGYMVGSAASTIVLGALPYFSKPSAKQLEKEVVNNSQYKDLFIKSFEKSGLKEKGVTIVDVAKRPVFDSTGAIAEVKAGRNAFYSPKTKEIYVNLDKASITAFHEAGHAINHLSSKVGGILQKCRAPGLAIASIMGTIALLTHQKPKNAKRNAYDWVQDNCGKIAAIAIAPTVVEEAIASYRGIKLAKSVGATENITKHLKKFYGKALFSYIGLAAVVGFSVFVASKIMEKFTRPRKLD